MLGDEGPMEERVFPLAVSQPLDIGMLLILSLLVPLSGESFYLSHFLLLRVGGFENCLVRIIFSYQVQGQELQKLRCCLLLVKGLRPGLHSTSS